MILSVISSVDDTPPARSTKTGINSYKRGEDNPKRRKIPLGSQTRWFSRGFGQFGKDSLTKKETVFRLSLWCARRDLNSRFLEYMVFLKLLFTQNARFESNIPIFPTDIFTLILLRVLVRVKIRVCFAYNKIAFQVKIDASEFTYS